MSKEKEEWKDIEGYEGLYQVSDWGRVRSLKILVPQPINSYKHLKVQLCTNYNSQLKLVHKLVAEAFIPNPNKYGVVHHIDHNPQNNKVENLIWMDRLEHSLLHGLEKSNKTDQIDPITREVIHCWKSANEAAKTLGIHKEGISMCCNGKSKTYKGYIWKKVMTFTC